MKKSWFDKRAEDGMEWAVVRVYVSEQILWDKGTVLWHPPKAVYYTCKAINIRRREVVGRNMAKKEAEAMAKLLGAIETN
jgi:AAA+ superfamily predicted ATPase